MKSVLPNRYKSTYFLFRFHHAILAKNFQFGNNNSLDRFIALISDIYQKTSTSQSAFLY